MSVCVCAREHVVGVARGGDYNVVFGVLGEV